MTALNDFATAGHSPVYGAYVVAPCLIVLANELAVAYPECGFLGALGNAAHVAEADTSDHNPIVHGPDGRGVVRAIDIGGPLEDLQAIEHHLNILYNAHDPRLYNFGYTHMNGRATVWDDNTATLLHSDPGDEGHLHVSVTQKFYPSRSNGWVGSLASLAPWGFLAPKPAPIKPAIQEDDDMEMIKNKDSGAVIAHLGAGVMKSVDPANWGTWNNLKRPVTELDRGPWNAYVALLSSGGQANVDEIAAAAAQAVANLPDDEPPALPAQPATTPEATA